MYIAYTHYKKTPFINVMLVTKLLGDKPLEYGSSKIYNNIRIKYIAILRDENQHKMLTQQFH